MDGLVSCSMCGGRRTDTRSEFCSDMCSKLYGETHSPALIKHGIVSDSWSYVSRCGVAMALIGEETKSDDADRFKHSVESLEALKKRLESLRKELPSSQSESTKQMQEWIVRFDKLMRSLDVIFSDEFSNLLAEHVLEFDHIHDKADAKTSSMLEVKKLLADLARAVPANRLGPEKREVLQKLLDKQAPRIKDYLVLTLDGGGMRGVVTLVMLMELLRLVRLKSGKKDAMLSDCFNMIMGTSTGGIIAACIAIMDMPLEKVMELYRSLGGKVFGSNSKVSATFMNMVVHYSDYTLLEFLLKICGTRRLDGDDTRFKDDSLRGPNGVRFAVTTLNIDTEPSTRMLIRNYESDRLSMYGTSRAFLVEAVRATTSAVTYLHPYRRSYAPLRTSTNVVGVQSSYYDVDPYGHYRTNIEVILNHAPTKQERDRLTKIYRGDTVMNEMVGSDGGTFANNPTEVAIQEARELFANEPTTNLVVANFGTGKLPSAKNRTWSSRGLMNPAERSFLGDHNIREVLTDLLNGCVVSPATDTECIANRVELLYGQIASVTRVNPPLRRAFRLDDFSEESALQMMEDATKYRDSPEGQALLNGLADKIVLYSDKLTKLAK